MNFRWITKSMVKKVNKFLNSKKSNQNKIKYEILKEDNINYFKDINENKITTELQRDLVISVINRLPDLNSEYSKNREKGSYIVYNPKANEFDNFRISNFNAILNDLYELKWFQKYSGIDTNIFKIRKKGHSLVKSSTTTLLNNAYMVSNYCRVPFNYCSESVCFKQNWSIYNANKVNKKYDNLLSAKLKTFRGWVRYDSYGKKECIKWLQELYNSLYENEKWREAIDLAALILSYFIKGECMSIEGEYRHLILSSETGISHIDFSIKPDYGFSNYSWNELFSKTNRWYKKIMDVMYLNVRFIFMAT